MSVSPDKLKGKSAEDILAAYSELYTSEASLRQTSSEASSRITDLEAILEEVGSDDYDSSSGDKEAKLQKAMKGVLELNSTLTKKIETIEKQQEGIARDNLEKYFKDNIDGYSELEKDVKDYIIDNPQWASNVKTIFSDGGSFSDAARVMRDVVDLVQMRKGKEKPAEQESTDGTAGEGSEKIDPKKEMAVVGESKSAPEEENESDIFKKTRTKELTQEDYSFYSDQMGLTDDQIENL